VTTEVQTKDRTAEPGTARIIPDDPVEAGTFGRWAVEYTVGASGIAPGGQVTVGMHWGNEWGIGPRFQLTDPQKTAYVRVETEPDVPFTIEYELMDRRPPRDSYVTRIRVVLGEKGLAEGDRLRVIFGAGPGKIVAQTYEDPKVQWKVNVDADGSGEFRPVDEHPSLRVVATEPVRLEAVIPSVVRVGEPVRLGVRAKDKYNNLVDAYGGRVRLRTDAEAAGLPETIELKPATGGISIIEGVRFLHEGTARIEVTDERGLEGTSNPAWVFAQEPPWRIYWGELHGHTEEICDGRGTVEEYYTFARDKALMDVCALGDHFAGTPQYQWNIFRENAKKFYEPGKYVTLLGYEWSNNFGDKNVYFRTTDVECKVARSPWEFERAYKHVPGLVIPHMTAYQVGHRGNDWDVHDPEIERLVEVYSCHGNSEAMDQPRPLHVMDYRGTVEYALRMGHRLGFIGGSDEHDGHPGDTPINGGRLHWQGGLAAIMAPELTRDAIFDALWDRMCYATTTARILVDFRIDGVPNGREYKLPEGADTIRISARISATGPVKQIQIIKNSDVFATFTDFNRDQQIELVDTPAGPVDYYYLRLHQKDTEMAWSSPIWVEQLHPTLAATDKR